jgi:hypothetical protein
MWAMTESKDDDLLPQTSPEIIVSPAGQDEPAPESAGDTPPRVQDREDSAADEK